MKNFMRWLDEDFIMVAFSLGFIIVLLIALNNQEAKEAPKELNDCYEESFEEFYPSELPEAVIKVQMV